MIIKYEKEFYQLKRNKCKEEIYKNKKKALELTYQHLRIRKGGSEISDPQELLDDNKRYNCAKCRKEKVVRKCVVYGSKCNAKLSKTCKICIDYRRKEDKRR